MYGAQLAAVPSYRPDLGEPWDIAKIYWGAMSESRCCARACARCARPATPTTFEGMDPDGRRCRSSCPTTTSPPRSTADDFVEQKMDAMRAHATQITVDGPFFALSNNVGNRGAGAPSTSGSPRATRGRPERTRRPGDDLFAGLPE